MLKKKCKTIKELCSFIWRIEKEYNLLDMSIDGVYPWVYRRIDIYYMLARGAKVLGLAHASMTNWKRLLKVVSYFKNSIIHNPFFTQEAEVAIFSHPRAKKVNGKNVDIYTYYIISDLIKNNVSYIDFKMPYLGEHRHAVGKGEKYLDFILLLVYILKPFVIVKQTLKPLKGLQKQIDEVIYGKIDILKYLKGETKRLKLEMFLYRMLFRVVKCKEVYIVPSYGNGAIIGAAKSMGIKTVEFQHGVFSKYHLGYSFPNRKSEIPYFPHVFYVWSNFWKGAAELPIENEKIKLRAFDYLQKEKERYINIEKESNTAVVISQGAIGKMIADKIYKNYEIFNKFETIYYKLHPGEYQNWKTYSSLKKMLEEGNVTLVDDCDLYQTFARCQYQIGVFSTALFEGIEFDCKTILLDICGIEYMRKFIEYYKPEIV